MPNGDTETIPSPPAELSTAYARFREMCTALHTKLIPLQDELQTWPLTTFPPLDVRPTMPEPQFLDVCAALCTDLELLTDDPVLRTGIVGGTQVGKSTVFNYLAGGHFAGVSEKPAATRWPLVLLPGGLAKDPSALVQRLFPLFEPRVWKKDYDFSDSPPSGKPLVFFRVDEQGILPRHLVLVDTPDVDSVVEQNCATAEKMVTNLDVVIAVTTNQKYNDARPTRFFRESVANRGRTAFLVLNQFPFDLETRREVLNNIITTFKNQSGLMLIHSYVARTTDTAFADARTLMPHLWPYEKGSDRVLKTALHDLGMATDIKLAAIRGTLQRFSEDFHRLQDNIALWRSMADSAMSAINASISTPTLILSMPPSALIFSEFGRWARKRALLSAVSLHSLRFFEWVGDVVLLRSLRGVDPTSLLKQWTKAVESEVSTYLSAVHSKLGEEQQDPVAKDACKLIRDKFMDVRRQVLYEVHHRLLGFEPHDPAAMTTLSDDTLHREFALEFHELLDNLYDSLDHRQEIDRVLRWVKVYSYARPTVTAAMLVTGVGVAIDAVQQAVQQAAIAAAKQAIVEAAKQATAETAKQAAIAAAKQATAEVAKAAALSLGETVATGAAGGTTGALASAYTGEGFKALLRWLLVGGHTALMIAMQNLVFGSLAAAAAYVETRNAVEALRKEMDQRTRRLAIAREYLDSVVVDDGIASKLSMTKETPSD